MQVGELDVAVVGDPEPPDAGAGQVGRHRRAERPRANHEHARVAQRALGGLAPLGQHELARVAIHPGVGDRLRGRPDEALEELAAVAHRRTIRTSRAVHAHLVAGFGRRARDVLERLAGGAHLELLAGRHPLELELGPHPRHRAREGGDVQRSDHHAGYGSGPMAARNYLILHGLGGSGPGHWQTWLAARLKADAERVAYPDLPDPDLPSPGAWRACSRASWPPCRPARRSSSATRSPACCGCTTWPRAARRPTGCCSSHRLRSRPGWREIEAFFPAPLPALAAGARLVCSDDDPYCPEGAATLYGEPLGIPTDVLPGAGHVNPETGYGPWPAGRGLVRGGRPPDHGVSARTSSRIAPG